MPKVSPLQSNFTGGEMSPLVYGRVDVERYAASLKTCLNYIPTLQGGLTRRPGTYYVAEVKTSADETRIVPFEFSTTQAYIIEFGDAYCRFYKDQGQIQSGGSPYEIVSPYAKADLFELKFIQSADVLYITHPEYKPRKLLRLGDTNWQFEVIDFQDGPYFSTNSTATTLSQSGTTVTASGTTGINRGDGFQSTDVGRLVRLKNGNNWEWRKITSVTSTTVVEVDGSSTVSATTSWRLGLWSDTTGYPTCASFHEDRLFFGGATNSPQRIDSSNTSDYENFAPTDTDGTIPDDRSLAFSFNANQVNVIRWILSDEKGLVVGTVGGEWVVRPSLQGEALTPINITARQSTTYGSADIQAVKSGKAVVFVQRSGRKIREFNYFFDVDGFQAGDLTVLANHITESGIKDTAYAEEPQPILWFARHDGVLVGVTYERSPDALRVGWHRHIIGGVSDADGSSAKVESVAVIPSPDTSFNQLWIVVQRYVDGSTVRYIEYLTKYFDSETAQEDSFFVDSGLTYDGAAATVFSGLDHLEGESVDILADGAVRPSQTVSGGQITLDTEASVVHIGKGYNSDGEMLRLEAGSADGTALGKTRRTHRVAFMLHRSLGLKVGFDLNDASTLDTKTFRVTTDPMGSPPELFSGIKSFEVEANYNFDNFIAWRQDQPLPSVILAVAPQMVTQDRG